MSGYTVEELLGMRIGELDVIETAGHTAEHLQELERLGFDRFETRHRRKDGTIYDVEISVSYWSDAGQLLAFVRDITERKLEDRRRERELRMLSWVGRVREALDNDRLVLHAQPIIDLHTGKIVSHELLIRMIATEARSSHPASFCRRPSDSA